jgi:hypothetical protein
MNPCQAFIDFVANRARKAGYVAYQAGVPHHAPAEFGEYSGAWVTGWNAAALDALDASAESLATAA